MCGILPRALAVPVVGGTSVPTGEYLRGAFVRRSRSVRLLDPRWPFPVACLPGCDVDIAPVPVASAPSAGPRIHLISWHARAAWAATRVPGGAGSYRRRELTRQLRRQRHDGRRQQRPSYRVQWIAPGVDRPTVGIGAATAAGTPGIRRPSQSVACALAARQRALPAGRLRITGFSRVSVD